jgi:putative peptidoglycan lipid II flippase
MNLAMFVAVPASAALVVIGQPIVVALFQRGLFDAVAAHETARALLWQGGAIWTVAAVRQTLPALYALGDTRSSVVVSALDLTVFIVLALTLRAPMGHAGISAAVAGSSTVQMGLLLAALKWRLGTLRARQLVPSAARTLAAAAAASLGGWATARWLGPLTGAGGLSSALPGLAAMIVFAVVFVLVAWALRAPELREIAGALSRRRAGAGATP